MSFDTLYIDLKCCQKAIFGCYQALTLVFTTFLYHKNWDYILSFKLTIGRLAFASEDMITNEAIAQLPVKRPDLVNQNYLYYYLRKYPWEQLGNTSSIATAVNSKTIKGMRISLPPLNIQKKSPAYSKQSIIKLILTRRWIA